MEPQVSILIPAFNAGEWISETIESALAQSWKRKEIIVVDDGSTDQTRMVAKAFAPHGVVVVTQTNQGAAATRNHLFRLSRGDYIQWLDADDLLSPDKIQNQVEHLQHGHHGERTLLSSAWGYFHYRTTKTQFCPTLLWSDLTPLEWLLRKMENNLHMQTATWLVSRALTEAAGPWDSRLLGDDDGEYFARVILQSDGIKFVPDSKVFYRRTGGARLSYIGGSPRKMEAQLLSMELNIGYVRSIDDGPRTHRACLTYLQCWSALFYPQRLDLWARAEQLATELGGQLEVPHLPWKYSWIQKLLGWNMARSVQIVLPRLRAGMIRSWDKALFRLTRMNAGF